MAVNDHPDAQWFGNAVLGLFIHWGIASNASVDLSWGMLKDKPWEPKDMQNHITPHEYWLLADKFDPDSYEPDRWLMAARKAGMEYAVFTAKHHDGYTMWPSKYGNFGSKRDFVREYIEACRRQGLKVGLYFSLIDWHNPDFQINRLLLDAPGEVTYDEYKSAYRSFKVDNGNKLAQLERYYRYTLDQIRELMTNYGKIDLLWFDGEPFEYGIGNIYGFVRASQPHIVVNGRVNYSVYGDYLTPEGQMPDRPPEGWWELCYPWHNGGWGYNKAETFKSMDWTLEMIAKTASWGGKLLLNIGPRPDGSLPDPAYAMLEELKVWMEQNSSSIKNVQRGPYPSPCDVPVTQSNGVWYLHKTRQHGSVVEIRNVKKPEKVRLLREPIDLEYSYNEGKLKIIVSENEVLSGDEVIAVTW